MEWGNENGVRGDMCVFKWIVARKEFNWGLDGECTGAVISLHIVKGSEDLHLYKKGIQAHFVHEVFS